VLWENEAPAELKSSREPHLPRVLDWIRVGASDSGVVVRAGKAGTRHRLYNDRLWLAVVFATTDAHKGLNYG